MVRRWSLTGHYLILNYPNPHPAVSVSSTVGNASGGALQIVAAPQAARGWAIAHRADASRTILAHGLGSAFETTACRTVAYFTPPRVQPLSHALTSDQFNVWAPRLLVWSGGGAELAISASAFDPRWFVLGGGQARTRPREGVRSPRDDGGDGADPV
jgi:hypothetical protein